MAFRTGASRSIRYSSFAMAPSTARRSRLLRETRRSERRRLKLAARGNDGQPGPTRCVCVCCAASFALDLPAAYSAASFVLSLLLLLSFSGKPAGSGIFVFRSSSPGRNSW